MRKKVLNENYGKFSPIPRYGVPDYKRDSSKWHDWIDEIVSYCVNGYEVGGDKISGRHFFKLNLTKIGITDKYGAKIPTYPFYADAQRELFDRVEYCFENGKNLIGLKGRDKGWTYDVSAIASHAMQIIDHATVLALFPGGTSVARSTFRNHYDMAYDSLDFDFKYPAKLSNSKTELKYGWKEIDLIYNVEKTRGPQSTLYMLEAVDESVVRSTRAQLIIFEEMGEIEGSIRLIEVADAVMREGAKKFGIIIAGGTSNCFNKGFKDFREIWYNPEAFGFEKIFIPAHKQYWGYVNLQTGESDMEGAKLHRMEIRSKKTGDALVIEKQEYPFDEKEAFYQGLSSPFDADKCNEQIAKILSDSSIRNKIQTGNWMYKKNDKGIIDPVWSNSVNGKTKVWQLPGSLKNLNRKCVGAIDSYRLKKSEDGNSEGAIEVRVPFQGVNQPGSYPVLIYRARPQSKKEFFMDSLMIAIAYDCEMLFEYTDEDLITFYEERGMAKYLKRRPRVKESANSKADYKYGIKPSEYNQGVALEYAIEDFNENYDQIMFVELLDEMIKFGTENTDRVWAHNWSVLHEMDNVKILDDWAKPKPEPRFTPMLAKTSSGQLIPVKTKEQAIQLGLIKRDAKS